MKGFLDWMLEVVGICRSDRHPRRFDAGDVSNYPNGYSCPDCGKTLLIAELVESS
jgi:hypothetical protein